MRYAPDEVMIPPLYWRAVIQLNSGESWIVACGAESSIKSTPQALAESNGPNSRWLIQNSPSAPSGAVHHRNELQGLPQVQLT